MLLSPFWVLALVLCQDGLGTIERSCGEKAVFATVTSLGVDCDIISVSDSYRKLGLGDTCSLLDLTNLLDEFELQSCIINIPNRKVDILPIGSIVHIHNAPSGHFSTFLGVEDGGVILANAPMPLMRMPLSDFKKVWSGKAIAVFRTHKELELFRNRLLADSGLRNLLIVISVLICIVLIWPYISRLKQLWQGWMIVLLSCFILGCNRSESEDVHSHLSKSESLVYTIPDLSFDSIYVPPDGANIKIIARYIGSNPLRILDIKTSCGCTNVNHPEVLLPGSESVFSAEITGSTRPSRRLLRISVETDQGNFPLEFTFETGQLPQVIPPIVSLHVDDRSARGNIVVWFMAYRGQEVVLEDHNDRFTIINGDCTSKSAYRAIINRSGACLLRLNVALDPEGKSQGQDKLRIRIEDNAIIIPFQYRFVKKPLVTVTPPTMTLFTSEKNQEKVFIVTSRVPFKLFVQTDSDHLSMEPSAISDRCWKVVCRPLKALLAGKSVEHPIVFQIHPSDGGEDIVINKVVTLRGLD